MWKAILAVAVGSAVGGLLRYGFSAQLNAAFPSLPPGTLVSNLVGGYIVGMAAAWFAAAPGLAPEWRLLLITGFCGGLTTFSSFSLEVVLLLEQERFGPALLEIATHLGGSLLMTALGIATFQWLRPA